MAVIGKISLDDKADSMHHEIRVKCDSAINEAQMGMVRFS